MWQQGFSCLTGCDPYLDNEVDVGGLRLIKADPLELEDSFDVVMAHHVFEHMASPHRTIDVLRRLTRKRLVIRVPVPGFAWRKYGVNWVALDPPRHLHIVSPEGMRRLAEAHGLSIVASYYDSWSLQFWGSEQYEADIPLRDPYSLAENIDVLAPEQLAHYEERSRELNAARDGDAAVFLLEPY